MNYKKLFITQFIFLILISAISFIWAKNFYGHSSFIFIWILSIFLNLIFIKRFALPRADLQEKLKAYSLDENPSWSEVEETLSKKDLTILKQQLKFEEENKKYKDLLNSIEEPICIFSPLFEVLYANKSFLELFSLENKSFPIPLIQVSRNLQFQSFLEKSFTNHQINKLNNFSFNQIQDINKRFFDIKIFDMKNNIDFLCLFVDITDRKLTDQIKEDFVSNFSHEVRTPLTILNGQIQNLKSMLQKESSFNQEYENAFIKIDLNTKRLTNLLSDLLQLTSVENKKEINKEEIQIEDMIPLLVQEIQQKYSNKDFKLQYEFKQNTFFVDYYLFEQALINLIDNAFKYGRVDGQISINTYSDEKWNHIIISDNGIGIPQELQHRIFERFFRVDASRSSQIEGTGLGLSIVKHIIQKHDGKIKVESAKDQGTSFDLAFPKL
jgi:two-component system phosphate regulon sensor histidine kinase PhoR